MFRIVSPMFCDSHSNFVRAGSTTDFTPIGQATICNRMGGPKKTLRTLRNYNGAYTLWGDISFGRFVDQYVLLLNYKFQ